MPNEPKTFAEAPSQISFPTQQKQTVAAGNGRRVYSREYVRSLFEGIAHRYDFLNHFLSSGFDVFWRRRAVEMLAPFKPQRILDVATGTGDLAIALLALEPQEIVGVDIAPSMLTLAQQKVGRLAGATRFRFLEAAAEQLPFDDNSFDAATVAFGVRNFSDLAAGLSELRRVLRPKGALLILEFSRPQKFPIKQLYGLYFRHILPMLGGLISGSAEAYHYLPATVAQFPDGQEFLQLVRAFGFQMHEPYPLTFGIASIYVGIKE